MLQMLGWWYYRCAYGVTEGWRIRTRWIASPVRDLSSHETHGHTIGRHISVPLPQLEQRISEGRNAASSFWDIAAARASVNFAITTGFETVRDWFFMSRDRRFELTVATPSRTSIGYGLVANERHLRYSRDVTVVLERIGPTFYILTAYPRVL